MTETALAPFSDEIAVHTRIGAVKHLSKLALVHMSELSSYLRSNHIHPVWGRLSFPPCSSESRTTGWCKRFNLATCTINADFFENQFRDVQDRQFVDYFLRVLREGAPYHEDNPPAGVHCARTKRFTPDQ